VAIAPRIRAGATAGDTPMDPALQELTRNAPIARFGVGERILAEGSPVETLYMLRAGRVEILKGDTVVATEETPGSIYGEMSLLLGEPATATVRAASDAEFWEFPCSESFLIEHPRLVLTVARLLARRLQSATRYLADVREQFAKFDDHVGMVDQVLDAISLRNPRRVDRRLADDPNDD
jgi:CRP-like cAMP-binding protein